MEASGSPKRPYAATANVLAVIERARTRNLPDHVDDDFLRIAGVGEAVHGRVYQALQFLDLVHPDRTPTDRLRAIAAAPEAEYRELLAEGIREAYGADFRSIDPASDDQHRIIDAFRRYEPRSQTTRMVMLFLGLCRAAGIPVLDAPRERSMQRQQKRTIQPKARPQGAKRRSEASGGRVPLPEGILFGVTEEDVAALTEEDFREVWTALGKVARARALSQSTEPPAQTMDVTQEEPPDDE